MTLSYIIVEGSVEAALLRHLLSKRSAKRSYFLVASGRSSAISDARTALLQRDHPVALVLDADTTVASQIEEQLLRLRQLLSSASPKGRFAVFLVSPSVVSVAQKASVERDSLLQQLDAFIHGESTTTFKAERANLKNPSRAELDTNRNISTEAQPDIIVPSPAVFSDSEVQKIFHTINSSEERIETGTSTDFLVNYPKFLFTKRGNERPGEDVLLNTDTGEQRNVEFTLLRYGGYSWKGMDLAGNEVIHSVAHRHLKEVFPSGQNETSNLAMQEAFVLSSDAPGRTIERNLNILRPDAVILLTGQGSFDRRKLSQICGEMHQGRMQFSSIYDLHAFGVQHYERYGILALCAGKVPLESSSELMLSDEEFEAILLRHPGVTRGMAKSFSEALRALCSPEGELTVNFDISTWRGSFKLGVRWKGGNVSKTRAVANVFRLTEDAAMGLTLVTVLRFLDLLIVGLAHRTSAADFIVMPRGEVQSDMMELLDFEKAGLLEVSGIPRSTKGSFEERIFEKREQGRRHGSRFIVAVVDFRSRQIFISKGV